MTRQLSLLENQTAHDRDTLEAMQADLSQAQSSFARQFEDQEEQHANELEELREGHAQQVLELERRIALEQVRCWHDDWNTDGVAKAQEADQVGQEISTTLMRVESERQAEKERASAELTRVQSSLQTRISMLEAEADSQSRRYRQV